MRRTEEGTFEDILRDMGTCQLFPKMKWNIVGIQVGSGTVGISFHRLC